MIRAEVRHSAAFVYYLGLHKSKVFVNKKWRTEIDSGAKEGMK
jgi:hypothetical protein